MSQKLSEMSLEELWRLFPVFLTEHRDCWRDWYAEEAFLLKPLLPQTVKIHHVGSTAVKAIRAKPIVDILAEVSEEYDLYDIKAVLVSSGYICMAQSAERLSFNKWYTENGFAPPVFHLHLRYDGDNDELYFRDYLNEFPDAAYRYETLKMKLWKRFENDRDGYTGAKTDFVKRYTREAKARYGNKY